MVTRFAAPGARLTISADWPGTAALSRSSARRSASGHVRERRSSGGSSRADGGAVAVRAVVRAAAAAEAEVVELVWIPRQVVPLPLHVPDAATAPRPTDLCVSDEHRSRDPDARVDAGCVLSVRVCEVELDPERAVRRPPGGSPAQERQQVATVHHPAAPRRATRSGMGQGQHRGCEVDICDRLADLGDPGAPVARWESDVEGGAVGLLVRIELSCPDPVLPKEDPVVRVEDEDRPTELSEISNSP